jgi:hypothetical protein
MSIPHTLRLRQYMTRACRSIGEMWPSTCRVECHAKFESSHPKALRTLKNGSLECSLYVNEEGKITRCGVQFSGRYLPYTVSKRRTGPGRHDSTIQSANYGRESERESEISRGMGVEHLHRRIISAAAVAETWNHHFWISGHFNHNVQQLSLSLHKSLHCFPCHGTFLILSSPYVNNMHMP